MARSKRQPLDKPDEVYCRKCQHMKSSSSFYSATDTFLDSNNLMSICKDCINDMYSDFFNVYKSMDKTIYNLCKILNIRYEPAAVEATKNQIETYEERGTKTQAIFGLYKSKLKNSVSSGKIGEKVESDLTFFEPSFEVIQEINTFEDEKNLEYYQTAWGLNLDMDDYLYLESEYGKLIERSKVDTYAEETYAREICYVRNRLRKDRELGKIDSKNIQIFQNLMKDSALTPQILEKAWILLVHG